ncbi:MAG: hypothetical protein ABIP93_06485 [Gemmatimonadaceae bacterium]
MRALLVSRSLPSALAMRAVVLWLLLRASLSMVLMVLSGLLPNPIAIIVICTIVGIVDIRRRRETMLWHNLGVSTTQLASLFLLTAVTGEMLLALTLL